MTAPPTQQSPRRAWLLPSARPYDRAWLRPDLVAGVAAGTVVIPQALAYATIAHLPVQIGLYTCIVPMMLYALLGGSRALSVSTTSTIAILVATILAGRSDGATPDDLLRDAFTLACLVGVCLLLLRLLHLGALVDIISPASMAGIKVGVGLTVAVGQLPALLGVPGDPEASGFFGSAWGVLSTLGQLDARTAALGIGSVVVLLVLRRVAPRVPGPLVVVGIGILLVLVTSIEEHGVALVAEVPSGLPLPVLPDVTAVPELLPGALAIAIMAFLETVLVARTNKRRDEPDIDVDQELVALGVASIGGGLTQTLPPAGGFSQSAVNLGAGARTQVAGLVTAVLAVLVALFLAPVLHDLPQAVLAAMVVVAVVGLLDVAEFQRFARVDPLELWVAVATAAVGLVAGLLAAVAVGVGLTLVLVLREVNRPHVRPLHPRPGGGWTVAEPDPDVPAPTTPGVLTLHLDSGLYAGNSRPTAGAISAWAGEAGPGLRAVVLDASSVRVVTVTMIDTLRVLAEQLHQDGIELVVTGLPRAPLEAARGSEWFRDFEGAGHLQPTVDAALRSVRPPTEDGVTEDGVSHDVPAERADGEPESAEREDD